MGKYILFVVVWLVNIVNPQIRCAQKSKSLYACMRVRVYACTRIRVFYCSTRESSVFHLIY